MRILPELKARIAKAEPSLPLAWFRIAFGLLMLWEVCRYFAYGRIPSYFIAPKFLFGFYGFEWLRPWPGNGMYWHFAALGTLAAMITLGLFYRWVMPLFFLGFSYVFLLDEALYLNHFYLICLLGFLLCFVPAEAALSIDALRRPKLRSATVPGRAYWILRAQLAIVYLFAAVAKMNADWLSGLTPSRLLLTTDGLTIMREMLRHPLTAQLFAYGGVLFDLLVVPALLWKPTRKLALAASIFFHLTNAQLLNIGVFPWLMLAATVFLFVWPLARRGETRAEPDALPRGGLRIMFIAYFAIQIALPLRHFLYPGDSNWTEEGRRFSWQMIAREKKGVARFFVVEPSGLGREIDSGAFLSPRQQKSMAIHPDMILQFARFLKEEFARHGSADIAVHAASQVVLNGRPAVPLIDPTVDLGSQPRDLRPAGWILPYRKP